jgi:hypothetical protein
MSTKILLLFCLVIGLGVTLPQLAHAQDGLRRMTVEQQTTDRILVFASHPDRAAVVITSSIPGLQIDTNLGIVADQSEPGTGEYRIILEPSRQIIYIDAPGFIRAVFQTGNLNPRDVIHLTVEPLDRSITDTGVLIIRTQPSGATIRIAGYPGTYTTPYTFDPILAQTHSVQIELQDYKTESMQIRVVPNRPVVEDIVLVPTFGFLVVNTPASTLFLRDTNSDTEYRRAYTAGQPLRLDVGRYDYRLARDFFTDATGSFDIIPNQIERISPELQPSYGTLRVTANTPDITLTSTDNNAPDNPVPNEIFLEFGRRTVVVSAPGYVQQALDVRIEPGQVMDRSVTLETTNQRDERARREQLPRGVLEVTADVDAEIWVNNQMEGTGSVVLTLIPDRYQVELRHPVRTTSFHVDIASASFTVRNVELRPVRSRALSYSALLPGMGHFYRNDRRGYAYVALFAGSVAYTFITSSTYSKDLTAYNDTQQAYGLAANATAANELRTVLLTQHQQVKDSRQALLLAAGVTAGLYAIQLLDVAVTRPRYGYRGSKNPRLSASVEGAGVTLRASF